MSKWADYAITAVQYDRIGDQVRIGAVEVRMDLGGRVGYAEIWRREQILDAVTIDHETFVTSVLAANGAWSKGAHVRVLRVNGIEYIRADRNPIAQDDLGGVPEF